MDAARDALRRLLWELPAEFCESPDSDRSRTREEFRVIKSSNVRTVHRALWDLQVAIGPVVRDPAAASLVDLPGPEDA